MRLADYNISGLVPAQVGGEWENGDSWFLFDESGEFSVDKDLLVTVYIVGGGACGGMAIVRLPDRYGGDGGNGGHVYKYCNLTIPKNSNCALYVGKGSDSNASNKSGQTSETRLVLNGFDYSSDSDGSTQALGGCGQVSTTKVHQIFKQGSDGINTPYGYVGSSGAGGYVNETYKKTHDVHGGIGAYTNYGGGGWGSDCGSSDGTFLNYGVGQNGCVIICVQNAIAKDENCIEIPSPVLVYNGEIQYPFGKNGIDGVNITGDINGMIAGEYYAYLDVTGNKYWSDGTREIKEIKWIIKRGLFSKPSASVLDFEYEGDGSNYSKTLDVSDYNANIMTCDGVLSAYKAGDYSVVYHLKDTSSSAWKDPESSSGESADDVVIKWKINKLAVPVPYFPDVEDGSKPKVFIYDGDSHSPVVEGYNEKVMSRSGSTESYAIVGNRYITYTLKDTSSCYWDDEGKTTAPKTLYWRIDKQIKRYPRPVLDGTAPPLEYNGKLQSPVVLNYDSGVMKRTGTLSSVAACKSDENGDYVPWEITFEFLTNPSYAYKWEDDEDTEPVNSAEKVVLAWVIEKAPIKEPVFKDGVSEFPFTGSSITPVIEGYDMYVMSCAGNTRGANAGSYRISYTLKDPDSAWWEKHPGDKTVTLDWEIVKATVPYPEIGNTVLTAQWASGSAYSQIPGVNY
ncbi:MAG: hypothetical protein NC401_14855, partial [Ruminococcus sp.]|nr:hypothetical protein [Ruminococcus sp.]